MKKEIKMENSLTPKNNISPKSDFAVLTHITAIIIRLKKRNVRINPTQPTVQTEPKNILWTSYRLLYLHKPFGPFF